MTDIAGPATTTVTLHDVARVAGVSLATASRALNGSSRKVQDAYRERVERAAAELGYTANLSAQATARGTSSVIALLVADIADPYFGEIAAGVTRRASEAGLMVTVSITERDPERELQLVRTLRGHRPRGMILAASRMSGGVDAALDAELAHIGAAGGRVVLVGHSDYELPAVDVDNRAAAAALGRALAGRGYRRVVLLTAAAGMITSDDRTTGFVSGFTSRGGDVQSIHHGAFTRDGGQRMMAEALTAGVDPGTLVFAVSDVVAVGAMSAIRAAGRSIGADIALAGFDDIPAARDVTPAITTVRVPLQQLGYEACSAAVDDDWSAAAARISLEVVLRGSTPER